MGIRSKENWSGTVIAGVLLGEPAIHEDGTFEWDGGVPNGVVDDLGVFTPDGEGVEPVALAEMPGVKVKDWVQPEGAHDAIARGTVARDDDGVTWVSLIDANVWAPGVSGWRRISEKLDEVFPWVQPTGGHDAYKRGAKVTHAGSTWENTGHDANVWAPGVFGWTKMV